MITQEDIDAMKEEADSKGIQIEVTNVVEHEDGGATYTFDMSDNVSQIVGELGLKLLLYCGMCQVAPQTVFENLANEFLKEQSK